MIRLIQRQLGSVTAARQRVSSVITRSLYHQQRCTHAISSVSTSRRLFSTHASSSATQHPTTAPASHHAPPPSAAVPHPASPAAAAAFDTTHTHRPLPFAVVGSGPAAFYTCKYLLREFDNISIDIFERLPAPGGLVRYGVAPDHPDVKSVLRELDAVLADDRCQFYGRVQVGKDITWEELRNHYSAIVLAYGAASERLLDLPGSDLDGIHPARHFVNWYNAHPEHTEEQHSFPLEQVEDVVIIGQGNVALDCARILLSPPSRLLPTDISSYALNTLERSRVRRVHMVGRRGAVQTAFSIGELREVSTGVPGMKVVMQEEELKRSENEASMKEIETSRPKKRKHDLIRQVAAGKLPSSPASILPPPVLDENSDEEQQHGHRELHVRFLLNPTAFISSKTNPKRVGAIEVERTELQGPPDKQEAVGTGEKFTIPAQLVLSSIGYKSLPMPGLPFDTRRSIIPNRAGRVINPEHDNSIEPGVYVSGWLKRGPSGIIATNIMDAREVTKSIVEDVNNGTIKQPMISSRLPLLDPSSIRAHQYINRDGWSCIDAEEQARGTAHGKPREKIFRTEEFIKVAERQQASDGNARPVPTEQLQ